MGGGTVLDDHGFSVSQRGAICWNGSDEAFLFQDTSLQGSGTETFSIPMNSLAPGQDYFVRAYATNYFGTGYGWENLFTTLMDACPGDRDTDGDVDGQDVAAFVLNPDGTRLEELADNFGKPDCKQ